MSSREALIDRFKLLAAGLFVVAVVSGFFGLVLFTPQLKVYPAWLTEAGAGVLPDLPGAACVSGGRT
jgi:hypothetical protein